MTDTYFRNTRTGLRYKIIRFDKDKNEVVLKGEYAEFTEKYDRERFKKMGYELEPTEEDHAEQS